MQIRFDGPNVSSDGGLLLVESVDKELGLTSRMAACLTDRRTGSFVHSVEKMLAQRVYGIALGWEDCNDFDAEALRGDPLYGVTLESTPASQPTLSRFENGVGEEDLARMSEELMRHFIDRYRQDPPKRIVIDLDATEDPAHGQQEFEFYHGFYQTHCFLPLLAFASVDGRDEELVGAVLRPGNSHAGKGSEIFVENWVRTLQDAFPKTNILFRADGGFALPKIYETCEKLKIDYLISLPRNSRLTDLAAPLLTQAVLQRKASEENKKVRLFGEISYAAGTWTKERRVVVKAEVMEKGENPRFVTTNLAGDPECLYDEYCKRGDCENRIKELKLDLASGRTSCHRFRANGFRLLLHALAFVLLSELRKKLVGTVLARSTLGQIRLKLLKIAAILQLSTRRFVLRMPRGHPHRELFLKLLA
jgi:hypothetical protein